MWIGVDLSNKGLMVDKHNASSLQSMIHILQDTGGCASQVTPPVAYASAVSAHTFVGVVTVEGRGEGLWVWVEGKLPAR